MTISRAICIGVLVSAGALPPLGRAATGKSGASSKLEPPVSRRLVTAELERLDQELQKLERKVDAATGRNPIQRPHAAPAASEATAVTTAEFLAELQPVRQRLADLALAVNGLVARPQRTTGSAQWKVTMGNSPATHHASMSGPVIARSVTIANNGSAPVVNPRLVVNGGGDWFSAPVVLHRLLRADMSDREKALALWRFVVANRRHDDPGAKDEEFSDPIRMLNAYGYGYCSNSACVLAGLADAAGMKARVWGLAGHVVPELYFDGGWRMLDPDHEIYYFEKDGHSIAGVEMLQDHPELIEQSAGKDPAYKAVIGIYGSKDNNRVQGWYMNVAKARHTMAYTLRPGEPLMRSTGNWGKYFSNLYLDEPEQYGNGRYTYEPRFAPGAPPADADAVHNIEVKADAAGAFLAAADPQRPATVVYRFNSPYPYLDGAVEFFGTVDVRDDMALEFSETGMVWQRVWAAAASGALQVRVPTSGCFRNGYGSPMHQYFLRLTLRKGAALRRIRVTSDIQVAPRSLPQLASGENIIEYQDETPGPHRVDVTFTYDPAPVSVSKQAFPPVGAAAAVGSGL